MGNCRKNVNRNCYKPASHGRMYGWVTACGTGFLTDRASAPKLLQLQHFTCCVGGLTGSVGECIVGADVSSQAACMAEDVALERDALRGQHTGGVRNGCAGYGVTGRNRKPQARGSRDAGRVTRWKEKQDPARRKTHTEPSGPSFLASLMDPRRPDSSGTSGIRASRDLVVRTVMVRSGARRLLSELLRWAASIPESIAEDAEKLGGPPSTDDAITEKRIRDRIAALIHIAGSSLPVPPTFSAISVIDSV